MTVHFNQFSRYRFQNEKQGPWRATALAMSRNDEITFSKDPPNYVLDIDRKESSYNVDGDDGNVISIELSDGDYYRNSAMGNVPEFAETYADEAKELEDDKDGAGYRRRPFEKFWRRHCQGPWCETKDAKRCCIGLCSLLCLGICVYIAVAIIGIYQYTGKQTTKQHTRNPHIN